MSEVEPIRIRKHTPVRHKRSRYLWEQFDGNHNWWPEVPLVTDLTRIRQTVSKVPKYDWTEWHEDKPKETLWQRIKRHYKEGLTE